MENIINYNLDKRNNIAPNLYEGNNSEEILINLKYPGQKDLKKNWGSIVNEWIKTMAEQAR